MIVVTVKILFDRPSDHFYVKVVGLPTSAEKVYFFESTNGNLVTLLDWYVPMEFGVSPLEPWGFDGKTQVGNNYYSIKYNRKNSLGILLLVNNKWEYAIVTYKVQNDNLIVVDLSTEKMNTLSNNSTTQIKNKIKHLSIQNVAPHSPSNSDQP